MAIRTAAAMLMASALAHPAIPAAATGFALDAGFGSGGKVVTDFTGPLDNAVAELAVLSDGRFYALDSNLDGARLSRHLANGMVDTGFGTEGAVLTDGLFGVDMALQSDGGIVVAGTVGAGGGEDFAVARYLADGQPDTGFGVGGVVLTDFEQGSDVANAVAIAEDDSIIVVGRAFLPGLGSGVALARYSADGALVATRAIKLSTGTADILEDVLVLPDGRILGIGLTRTFNNAASVVLRFSAGLELDTDFGNDGLAFLPLSGENEAYAGAVQPDGRIVVAGDIAAGGGDRALMVARLLADGTLDGTFGSGGWTATAVPGEETATAQQLLLDNGRILIAVRTFSVEDFLIARYTADGDLDPGFGSGGLRVQDFNGDVDTIRTIAWHSGGLLAAGSASPADPQLTRQYGFARYDLDGQLDGSFGTGGLAQVAFAGPVANRALGLAEQPDGRILAIGYAGNSFTDRDFAISRYLDTGALDTAFGEGGRVRVDFDGSEDTGSAIAVQPNGRVVAAGVARVGGMQRFGVARFLDDGQPDPGFGSNGRVAIDVGMAGTEPLSLVLGPDGRILVAGTTRGAGSPDRTFVVVALTASGQLDVGFGDGGMTVVDVSLGFDFATAIALRADGSILVAGSGDSEASDSFDFQVLRLSADGSVDAGFGIDGKVEVDFAGRNDIAYALAVVGAGASERTYVIGSAQLGASSLATDFAAIALDPAGVLVPAFGSAGTATFDISGGIDSAFGVVVQDQRLVLAGGGPQSGDSDFQLLALDLAGEPDPTFSATGAQLAIDFTGRQDEAQAALLDEQGRLLLTGWVIDGTGIGAQDFGLARLAPVVDSIFDDGFETD